jgi:hypothetical protein
MKKIITLILVAFTLSALAQENGDSKIFHQPWTFLTDQNGTPLASEKATQGKHYLKNVLNFTSETKYEFSLEEFDSAGTKLTQVTENGTYTLDGAQFTLLPKNSETIFNPPADKKINYASSTRVANPLIQAMYSWAIEKNKSGTSLIITATKPGYREGIFSSTTAVHKKASRPGAFRSLPPDKQREIAHDL